MGTEDQQTTPPADETTTQPVNANDLTNVVSSQRDEQTLALFNAEANERIRKIWHDGRWWYSVIDTVGLLSGSDNPRVYWAKLKERVQDEGFAQVLTKCQQLKMRSADGKMRTTDAADRETLFRIGQSIPSPKAEPFKQWLARTAEERLQEEEQPSKALDRLSRMYARQGYTDEWIGLRVKKILVRDAITLEWAERGARTSRQIAQLTSELHEGTFAITPAQHREVKDLPPGQNLQDSMTGVELALNILGEEVATELHQARDSQGLSALRDDVHDAGRVSGNARKEVEALTGRPVVSPVNYKQLRQERQRQLQSPLFGEIAEEE
ncbi:MAG TPA: Bro-N domain-containing protein [Ktedonobacterales bacterium]|nr:Bro-N domain-containing protein [Ktedonobacterales bacterium]